MSDRILLVDDEKRLLRSMKRQLESDYQIDTCDCPLEALGTVQQGAKYAVVVSDHLMPRLCGVNFLTRVRTYAPDSVRIMLTGSAEFHTAIEAVNDGRVFRFLAKPCPAEALRKALNDGLQHYRFAKQRKHYTSQLEVTVRQQTRQIRAAHEETIYRLITASSHRDQETGAHIQRVGLFSHALAIAIGWDETEAELLRLAAPMHDVGKIGIPDAVLQKPGKLSKDEFAVMQTHTTLGAQMLDGSNAPVLQLARDIALSHHERWDGGGYPHGKSGEEIPLAARIVSIVDVYDALSHDRVYRKAVVEKDVLEILANGRGTHHDERLLDNFMKILPVIRRIAKDNPDEQQDKTPDYPFFQLTTDCPIDTLI